MSSPTNVSYTYLTRNNKCFIGDKLLFYTNRGVEKLLFLNVHILPLSNAAVAPVSPIREKSQLGAFAIIVCALPSLPPPIHTTLKPAVPTSCTPNAAPRNNRNADGSVNLLRANDRRTRGVTHTRRTANARRFRRRPEEDMTVGITRVCSKCTYLHY